MLFQYPGLMMMSLAGAGAAEVLVNPDGWLRGISAGLSAAGVALVVSAAVGLAVGQCKDQTTSVLCLLSSIVAYYYTRYVLYFPNPNTACRLSRVIMHAPGPKD